MNMDNSRTVLEATDVRGEISVSIRVYRCNKWCFIICIFRLDNMLTTGSSKVVGRYTHCKLFYAFWNETQEVC